MPPKIPKVQDHSIGKSVQKHLNSKTNYFVGTELNINIVSGTLNLIDTLVQKYSAA